MAGQERWLLERSDLQQLLDALRAAGYQTVGPVARDGAIVYDSLERVEELPAGWTDRQDGGSYRLERRDDQALFGYAVGPHSWKRFLHPPRLKLWRAERTGAGFRVEPAGDEAPRYAFFGVRACELHAIAIQDRVLLGDRFPDPVYRARRDAAFIVALNCSVAGRTCFCASMNTGPRAASGFDLALTEILDLRNHFFVVEIGTERGAQVLAGVARRAASAAELAAADEVVARTAASMGRELQADGLPGLLLRNLEHPRWDEVAARCLSCGNCTMVCPTCFCTSVEDLTDLSGDSAERVRRWDSCFTMEFSHLHGGSVRASAKSRYRQWMTHKLATWVEQFGSSGCVGCGRCITWCPVGIDLTEEALAIRQSDGVKKGKDHGRA
ncbi:MAG TPA: 4Fe-4S dicluster domain-containing protein [Burkholderiales bacterium]|nr:4Fe-4S dicluster domain-containing protein [Burkholderiales bacterium]